MNDKSTLLLNIDKAIELTHTCSLIGWNEEFPICVTNMQAELSLLKRDIEEENVSTYYYPLFLDVISMYVTGTEKFLENIRNNVDRHSFMPSETFHYTDELIRIRYLFSNLGYFNTNIVIVGANGSGKTILANTLKNIITSKSGVVIPAQKIMVVPSYNGLFGSDATRKNLEELQSKSRDSKVTYDVSKEDSVPYSYMQDFGRDFKIVLDNLLSENNEMVHRRDALHKLGQVVDYSNKSNLEKTIEIWESLIKHRKIKCENGYKLQLSADGINDYSLHKMSDGEKVILYNVAHIIQAPANSIIAVDEPEMFLHKTITAQLWNKLEEIRKDCLFIYLTHDLEFAICRVNAKKAWIKSFEYSFIQEHKWEIESLPQSEIPDELLLRLLGSRKTILFCEGIDTGSLDKQIFEVLFPNLTITPVSTCKDVINYTKSYNKIPNLHSTAIGIIDTDYRTPNQLSSLKRNKVYSLPYSEIENLFFDEGFLKLFASKYDHDMNVVEAIKKEVMNVFNSQKNLQVSNFISAKINHFFTESHVSRANTKDNINKNFNEFKSKINIDVWYDERSTELDAIVSSNDYLNVIKVFNNKGLSRIANKHFKILNFEDKALYFLKHNFEAKSMILKTFPVEMVNLGAVDCS